MNYFSVFRYYELERLAANIFFQYIFFSLTTLMCIWSDQLIQRRSLQSSYNKLYVSGDWPMERIMHWRVENSCGRLKRLSWDFLQLYYSFIYSPELTQHENNFVIYFVFFFHCTAHTKFSPELADGWMRNGIVLNNFLYNTNNTIVPSIGSWTGAWGLWGFLYFSRFFKIQSNLLEKKRMIKYNTDQNLYLKSFE
jgi:hypothetical protein